MIICLDIGNTHIYGGVFKKGDVVLRFRYPSTSPSTSDIFGLFLRDVLDKNGLDFKQVQSIAIASVVPILDYSIVAACKKYFSVTPLELKPGVKTGLRLDIKNPVELGADRIANSVAAIDRFPHKNIIIVDFGTATTVCAIAKEKVYVGGAILPGFKVSIEALSQKAAKLLGVDIIAPESALGKSTETQLQSGLFYGQLGAIKEIVHKISKIAFPADPPILISTGGYAHLFEKEGLFSDNLPDLVLEGLRLILEKNS
jgi:type III pantothenate kinase